MEKPVSIKSALFSFRHPNYQGVGWWCWAWRWTDRGQMWKRGLVCTSMFVTSQGEAWNACLNASLANQRAALQEHVRGEAGNQSLETHTRGVSFLARQRRGCQWRAVLEKLSSGWMQHRMRGRGASPCEKRALLISPRGCYRRGPAKLGVTWWSSQQQNVFILLLMQSGLSPAWEQLVGRLCLDVRALP